jgi:cell shape-determining protein MreC
MIPKRQFVPTHTKSRRIIFLVCFLALIACFAISPIRKGIRWVFGFAGTGIVQTTNGTSRGVSHFFDNFRAKHTLIADNDGLKAQIAEQEARLLEYNLLVQENSDLKAMLNRTDKASFTLASILAKPPRSLYDTLLIDGGENAGLLAGQTVYANGTTPIGSIQSVSAYSALVKLFSTSGEKYEARLEPSHIDVQLVGRGGGNFYVIAPHDLVVDANSTAVSKDINPHVIAQFQKVVSDPRDPFQTLLFSSPINIHEISFVEVKQ